MEFHFDKLGQWTEEQIFEVTGDRIRLYAEAIDDTNPTHLRGELAPPIFAVVPSLMGVHTKAIAMAVKSEVAGYDTRMPPHDRRSERDQEPVGVVTHRVHGDQSFRYAEASGDHGVYHLDEIAAKSAGFPGLILHGLCTMAFSSRAIVARTCGMDGTRLKRLAVRFTRPVSLDQEITTTIWRAGDRDGRQEYAFEVLEASGRAVIKMGLAEVAA